VTPAGKWSRLGQLNEPIRIRAGCPDHCGAGILPAAKLLIGSFSFLRAQDLWGHRLLADFTLRYGRDDQRLADALRYERANATTREQAWEFKTSGY